MAGEFYANKRDAKGHVAHECEQFFKDHGIKQIVCGVNHRRLMESWKSFVIYTSSIGLGVVVWRGLFCGIMRRNCMVLLILISLRLLVRRLFVRCVLRFGWVWRSNYLNGEKHEKQNKYK
jgi:hypothetical protein